MFEQKSAEEACGVLETDSASGLSAKEAAQRLERDGFNELTEKKPKSLFAIFLSQLNDPMIYILFFAAGVSIWHHEPADAIIILAVVLLNAIIGMTQESKAEAALTALKQMSSPFTLVRRDGRVSEIPAKELVTGDIVILEAGRVIPADLRLLSSINLKIEESALTGESVPVEKDANFIANGEIGIGDRLNMTYSSTTVSYGRGEGVVAATGMNTEIGKIATILNTTKTEMTPLQKRLAGLGKMLGIAAIIICAAMFGLAIVQGRDFADMMLTAISLAVAAVPEGLPAVVTIVLALGVQRLVKVNTIVRRLPSVETLGSVTVVCSDKTGTLTQNKMTVVKVFQNETMKDVAQLDLSNDRLFIEGFVLCNDASVANGSRTGDPTELALIDMGENLGVSREGLEQTMPRVNERAFDSDRKLMTTVHKLSTGTVAAFTKGAMDNILARSESILINGERRGITDADKANITAAAHQMAQSALRVLGLAVRENDNDASEEKLTFVGLVGMIDPSRPEAKESVARFKGAGVRTVMITGDHRDTALAIAKELGIAEDESQCMTGEDLNRMSQEDLNKVVNDLRVFARVSPQHKVMIVQALKSHGHVVSMTGDGVNDAPSLKAADIGVAMGITGTDVAKGASDMVLTDDNFATIGKAVEEGRNIYGNIKKYVLFTLSSNLGEIFTVFFSIAAGFASPLKAIHILWVNLITDSLPGLALGMDPGDPDIMKAPPRKPQESLFADKGLAITLFYGVVVTIITIAAFLCVPVQHVGMDFNALKLFLEDENNLRLAQTFAFVTLATSQLFHAIGMRNVSKSVFKMNHLQNKAMIVAFFAGLAIQLAITEIHILTEWFGTTQLSLPQWGQLLLFSIVPLVMHEIIVLVKWLKNKAAA